MNDENRLVIRLANLDDREEIYRLRHEVYARELGQHPLNVDGRLSDELDEINIYLVATHRGQIAGFISITPPGFGRYSVEKYISRREFPELFKGSPFELRLLTIAPPHRGRVAAYLLMYAAFRWVTAQGASGILGMGRRELIDFYCRMGMEMSGREIRSGAVMYELMSADMRRLSELSASHAARLNRLERMVDWQLEEPFHAPANCFHGGAFFDAIGTDFNQLERRHEIINADVLDAWFPPSPGVLKALQTDPAWLLRTSPPADCGGLVRAIARTRGVPAKCVLPGAGSSALIFLALGKWLGRHSRVLVLDPTYGEYRHVLDQVIRCRVEYFSLKRKNGYAVDLSALQKRISERAPDLVILVNPNSPSGRHVSRSNLEDLLREIPMRTRVWVDETYVDYAGSSESLEAFAIKTSNVVVCKSMSKVYALSGARVAYLCGPTVLIEELRGVTPPWAVSLPAQIAAVRALEDSAYYARHWLQTGHLREKLATALSSFAGGEVVPGVANFLLCHMPEAGPDAAEIVRRCRERDLFLRDAGGMGRQLGRHALRIAVKDEQTNRRIITILREALVENDSSRRGISSTAPVGEVSMV